MTKTDFTLPLEPYKLRYGSHSSRRDGMCLLELAAYLAGREHSDMPQCVAPTVRRMGIALNDRLNDERRQILRPYLLRMLGTAADGREAERQRMATEWLLHYALPTWLDLAGRQEAAQRLRDLPGDLALKDVREAIRDAHDGAWDARRSAYDSFRQRVKDELAKRVVAADAAIAAAAAAAADAAAIAAAADAAADAAIVGAAAADAAADAVVADAAVAGAAIAAAAIAAVAIAADAATAEVTDDGYWPKYHVVYNAVYRAVKPRVEEVIKPTADAVFASAIELFDRMLPEEPLVAPKVEGAEIICAAPEAA